MPEPIHKLSLWVLALALVSCMGSPTAGGAGSDAGNAFQVRIYRQDGTPSARSQIEVRSTDSPWEFTTIQAMTDDSGIADLRLPVGNWSVLARKDGLAALSTTDGVGILLDTLRPIGTISGILVDGGGTILSVPGTDIQTQCDASGYFRLDALPSGNLPLQIGSAATGSSIRVDPGVSAIALPLANSLPSVWKSLPADTLIPWASLAPPLTIPKATLGDTGAFSVAVRLRRLDSLSNVWAISWTDSADKGIRIGWRGADTFVLELDGKPYMVAGIPLTTKIEQVGLSWDGRQVMTYLGQDSLIGISTRSLGSRSTWKDIGFATEGIRTLEWAAYRRGLFSSDWVRALWML